MTGQPLLVPGRSPAAAAVLFDMDGLLVDSEPEWFEVETALVTRLGGRWAPADQLACMGGTLRATADYIATLTGTAEPAEHLMEELLATMTARFSQQLPLQPGALAVIDAVRSAGVPTGLVTSTYRRLLDAALLGLGAERFDVTVAGDEVASGKPDPAPYLAACERLQVDPADCVVLEDTPTGVRSGENAGCVVVAVPSAGGIEPRPHRPVLPSLVGLDVGWLLSLPRRPDRDSRRIGAK